MPFRARLWSCQPGLLPVPPKNTSSKQKRASQAMSAMAGRQHCCAVHQSSSIIQCGGKVDGGAHVGDWTPPPPTLHAALKPLALFLLGICQGVESMGTTSTAMLLCYIARAFVQGRPILLLYKLGTYDSFLSSRWYTLRAARAKT